LVVGYWLLVLVVGGAEREALAERGGLEPVHRIALSPMRLVCLLAAFSALLAAQPARQSPSLLIRSVSLIDGNGGPPRTGVSVLARDGHIASVDTAPTETADLTIDGRGLFLLPVTTSRGYRPGDAPWNREIDANTDLVRAGATSIKLYAALDALTVRRIGDEALRQNMRVIAHATVFPARPSDLVTAGVKMLAHTAYLAWEGMPPSHDFSKRARADFGAVPPDGPVMTRLLQSMKDHDVTLNPTLWIFSERSKDDMSAARIAWQNAVTRRAQDIGVVIAAGVDTMTMPDDPLPALHKELEVMVNGARLTPMQAIVSATRGAAHAIGVDDDRGTVAVGKVADLLIVDADPSADIRNTRRIRYVIKDGRIAFTQPSQQRQQGQPK
jgi:Amidohydrolase family